MSANEMPRPIRLRQIDANPVRITATPEERAALSRRFGVVAVDRLGAEIMLEREGEVVSATGRIAADLVQTCGVSGEDFPVRIDEALALRFVPEVARSEAEEEIELAEGDLDELEYSGDAFDLGEAVAQSLGLAIDPYATGPRAQAVREQAGITGDDAPRGPLADALAKLKKG